MQKFTYKQELYRKIIHLSSIWIAFAIYFLKLKVVLPLFLACAALVFIYEILRRKSNPHTQFITGIFGKLLRDDEKQSDKFKMSGAIYFFISAFLCSFFFPKSAAIAAMTVLVLGDSAAALVGGKFGRIKFSTLGKSLEGSAAFFAVSVIAVFVISKIIAVESNFLMAGMLGCVAGTLAELVAKKILIDDNLLVPLMTGAVITFFI